MDHANYLSEATAVLEAMATHGIRIDDRKFEGYVAAVIEEYVRRGRVEKAAVAYVMACLCNGGIPELTGTIDEAFQVLAEVVQVDR